MKKILYAIDGRFGNKVLKPQYRVYWRLFTYGTLFILFFQVCNGSIVRLVGWSSEIIELCNLGIIEIRKS